MGKIKRTEWFWGRFLEQFSGKIRRAWLVQEHGGACGARGGALALLLSFPRTQDVGSKGPLPDDII